MDTLPAILVAALRWLIELFRGLRLDLAERRGKELDHE